MLSDDCLTVRGPSARSSSSGEVLQPALVRRFVGTPPEPLGTVGSKSCPTSNSSDTVLLRSFVCVPARPSKPFC